MLMFEWKMFLYDRCIDLWSGLWRQMFHRCFCFFLLKSLTLWRVWTRSCSRTNILMVASPPPLHKGGFSVSSGKGGNEGCTDLTTAVWNVTCETRTGALTKHYIYIRAEQKDRKIIYYNIFIFYIKSGLKIILFNIFSLIVKLLQHVWLYM